MERLHLPCAAVFIHYSLTHSLSCFLLTPQVFGHRVKILTARKNYLHQMLTHDHDFLDCCQQPEKASSQLIKLPNRLFVWGLCSFCFFKLNILWAIWGNDYIKPWCQITLEKCLVIIQIYLTVQKQTKVQSTVTIYCNSFSCLSAIRIVTQ